LHFVEADSFCGTIIAMSQERTKTRASHFIQFTRAGMNETLHFLTQHGTIVLFVAVFAEQIGLPVPALLFLIAAGALVGTGQMALGVSVGAAVLAALMGDQLWYELGRRRGRQVLNWLCRISLEPTSCIRRTEDFFTRYGARSLVVAKFVPGLSTIAPPLAGIVGLRVPQYLLYNGLGTVLWVSSGIGLGYAFSDQLEQATSVVAYLGPTMVLILLGSAAGYVISKALNRYRVERRLPRLTVQDVTEKIAAGEAPVIIDLRPHGARREVPGIPGSLPLSVKEVMAGYRNLPLDRDVILYCACPWDRASVQTARRLREKGLTRVWPLVGGIEAWHAITSKTEARVGGSEVHTVAA
jgi:membrane protein DedA with SNARE-associated domain/rhodanese-related sulfurtransferase